MTEKVAFTPEQQILVDELVGTARVKARDVAKTQFETEQVKMKEDSEKAAMAANQEWQELAKKHGARVTELEPLQAQVETYKKLVGKMLRDRVKELGDAAKQAVDGLPDGMTALDKLAWLTKNEGLFKSTGDGVGTPQGKKQPTPQSKEIEFSKEVFNF